MIWMLLIAVHLYLFYLSYSNQIFELPFLLGIELPMPLFYSVFLLFYVGSMTEQIPKKKWTLSLHFLPIIASYLYLITFFILPVDQKIYVYEHKGLGFENYMLVVDVFYPLHGLLYIIWSLKLLNKHKRNIKRQFSNLEKINLRWLRVLIYCTAVLWTLVLFLPDTYIFVAIVLFVFIISFFGIKQDRIFAHGKLDTTPIIQEKKVELPTKKYAKSGLTEEQSEKIYKQLINLLTEDKLFQNGELTILELANRLETKANYLSQIINEKENKNFYDFINNFRLMAFKAMVTDQNHKKFTLLAMAYECGFSSKSSFNRYFKKTMEQTPTEYVNQIKSTIK